MNSVWLLLVVLLACAAPPNEALLLSPSGGRVANHARVKFASPLWSSRSSSNTALFFKNSTKADFDIDEATNPLTSTVATASDEEEKAALDDGPGFDDNCFPGRDENERFECDPSVEFWREWQNVKNPENLPSAQDNLREMNAIARRFARGGAESAAHFGKHIGRTAYFAVNAVLGDAAFKFSNNNESMDITMSRGSGPFPMGLSGQYASRLILEALLCYEQDYFEGIKGGKGYREPWDMASLSHRQSNPLNALTQTSRFMREAVGTLGRRARATEQDKEVRFFQSSHQSTTTGSKLYPEYYQTAFHFQGDGWMSTDSANVYETSTETLFLGRQDSMQRTSLPPLVSLAEKFADEKSRPMRVLEVACGTGRFMTFVRDNLPLDTEYTASDLSPFYLEKASDNDSYWRKTREDDENKASTSSTTAIAPATLVQAQAESLPFEDGSFDAVVCVYLFHELPREIRARAAAEMARVVAPGGTVVLTDSIQKGDRPSLDTGLPNFKKMNEPYYVDYVNDNLGGHFEAMRLIPNTKIVRSTTKSLSFFKPGELSL